VCTPSAFKKKCSALHAACYYGTPTVDLLHHLLQLDSAQSKVLLQIERHDEVLGEGRYGPLGHMCYNMLLRRNELPHAELIDCFLKADTCCDDIVGDAIDACIFACSKMDWSDEAAASRRLLGMIELLLTAKPEAAKHREPELRQNLLHSAVSWCGRLSSAPLSTLQRIMHLILALHKDAVREADNDGCLPLHTACRFATVDTVDELLTLYPEAANARARDGSNLLHLSMTGGDEIQCVSVVERILALYPAMLDERDDCGWTPMHLFMCCFPSIYLSVGFKILMTAGVDSLKVQTAHPSSPDEPMNGYTPLHVLIGERAAALEVSLLSETADVFRSLLRLYPAAASVVGISGDGRNTTAYALAREKNIPEYYIRLLLRVAPHLNPPYLRRLNYAERRMAMFLAFKAIPATVEDLPLLLRLRAENTDLVARVVSFL
jgi:hypothetical protein